MKNLIDVWANFLSNEKLVPGRMKEEDTLTLISLCEKLASIRGPKISQHKFKLESRELVCNAAIDIGIDLPSIKHKVTGKLMIGRGLLDAWNKVIAERFGSSYGTQSAREAIRRNISTKLATARKEDKE